MDWLNEPSKWSVDGSHVFADADPNTDFWSITDYGFVRDNAHIYGEVLSSGFKLTVRIQADYVAQYDQAGTVVRVDGGHWIKTGVELFDGKLRFSVVVTIEHSNWMIADLPEGFTFFNLSLERRADAVHISYSTDENPLQFASVVYLEPGAQALAGVMCASPQGEGFSVHFSDYELSAT
jgi:regulation of enolase protein 1 (concanavalin A-like superfamily)